jgi:signal transduction histidine kinase
VEALEAAMAANQRDLRKLVDQLQPGQQAKAIPPTVGLAETIEQMRERMQRDWGLDVHITIDGSLTVPPGIARDVSLMISEALVNAARHGHASAVDLRVTAEERRVTLRVADNGDGFPFQGRRNEAELAREQIGPVSLRERVASLNGTLVVDSSNAGARIEISVPITEGT